MSELNEKQPQQPQQSNRLMEIPEYINVDALRREEFLSQVGSFSSEHRKIFQLLCEHWQPGISYKRFISQVKGVKFAEKDLIGLLTRLKTAKCGLLKHKCISGILEKRIIILTDKGEKSFYYHFLEDEIEVSMQSSLHPMVKSSKLLDDNIEIPDSFIEVLTPRHITRSFFKQCINDERIFSIPTSEDDSIMATSGTISSIISMSIRRIRDSLKNSNVLAIVAKIQAKTIMDLKRDLLLNDPTYWRKLTIAILDAKDEILQASRSLNKDFFKANELIRFFSENEIKALEKKRAEELEMFNEMKTIAHEISKKENYFLDQSELNKKLETNLKKWPGFKEKFYENFTTSKKKTQLPHIVYIGQQYIHRDNIYTFFLTQLAMYSAELRSEYQKLMESMLRTNNRSRVSIFYSKDNLRNNIREKLNDWDPLVIAFLDHPSIVSEAVIHTAKKKKNIHDITKIRSMLEMYFEPGKLRYKPLEVLYNLDILEIFQCAFLKIPIWKQFFIKVLGRYDSYRKAYMGLIQSNPKPEVSSGGVERKKSNELDFSNMSKEERKHEYRKRQAEINQRTRKSPSRSKMTREKKRQYTLKEQNEAWDDFDDSFSKKKNIVKKKNN